MVTRGDLKLIAQTLNKVSNEKMSGKLAFAIAKNIYLMKGELEALEAAEKASIGEFEAKRIELCEKYAEKDETGNVITIDGKYQGLTENIEFIKVFSELSSEYKDKFEELDSILKAEVDIKFITITPDDIPSITPAESYILLPLFE